MAIKVRRATIADLETIESLWKEMAIFHQELDPYFTIISEAEDNHRRYMIDLLQDESKRVFVADDSVRLLGYLVADVKSYPPIYKHKYYGHIGAISVTASARRKGIGKMLLNKALAWFREQQLQRVECGVAVLNNVSQAFWDGMGFRGFMEIKVLEL